MLWCNFIWKLKMYKIGKFAKHTTTIIMEFWKNFVKWTLDQSIRSNRRLPRELLIISGFFCQLKMGLFGCIIPSRNLDSHSKKDSWIEEGPPFPALTSAQTPWSSVQTNGLQLKVISKKMMIKKKVTSKKPVYQKFCI